MIEKLPIYSIFGFNLRPDKHFSGGGGGGGSGPNVNRLTFASNIDILTCSLNDPCIHLLLTNLTLEPR